MGTSGSKGAVYVTTERPNYISGDVINGIAHLQLREPTLINGGRGLLRFAILHDLPPGLWVPIHLCCDVTSHRCFLEGTPSARA